MCRDGSLNRRAVRHHKFPKTYSESKQQMRKSFLHSKVQRCLAILDNISDRKWHQEETFPQYHEQEMHVTMTTANCPVRGRHNLFHLYGVWLEHKAGPPKVILWPPSFNLPKQICRHQCSSPMFPYKSNLDRPEFYFVTVLYSLSVDFRIVLRMHFTFCNFLLPAQLQIDAKRREKRWLCTRRSLIFLQGEKSGLWSSSPRYSAMKIDIPHVSLLLLLQPNI